MIKYIIFGWNCFHACPLACKCKYTASHERDERSNISPKKQVKKQSATCIKYIAWHERDERSNICPKKQVKKQVKKQGATCILGYKLNILSGLNIIHTLPLMHNWPC